MKKLNLKYSQLRIIIAIYITLVTIGVVAGFFVYTASNANYEIETGASYEVIKIMNPYDPIIEPIEPISVKSSKNTSSVETFENAAPMVGQTTVKYFDVPLDESLQDHIFDETKKYGIDPALVIAIINRETRYRPDVIGDNGKSYGIMQIQKRWHEGRMASLGVTDLLNPYQNVSVGVNYLAELFETGNSIEWVLMAYNGGMSYANRNQSQGVVSKYANDVLRHVGLLNEECFDK